MKLFFLIIAILGLISGVYLVITAVIDITAKKVADEIYHRMAGHK